jgi:2-deoxystreptamine N-acetyl-D-glucosaminyltransferase/2-deoxystreptamine glucosyltransferase
VLRITPAWDWRASAGGCELTKPEESLGGQAAQVLRTTRATAALGVEQTVITLRATGGPPRAALQPGVDVVGVGRPDLAGTHRRNLVWLAAVLADLRRRRKESWDVVHVHASGIIEPLMAARMAGAILRRPLVLTLHHSAQATYLPSSRRDAALTVLTRAAERSATRAAARTLTLTRRVAARLEGTGRFEAVPDSLDADAFAAAAQPERGRALMRALGVPDGAQVALYAGRVSREKGWPDLVALAIALPELHVVVCGDGPDRAALEGCGVENMHLAGVLPTGDVAAAMAGADVFVLPSVFEELGSVLIEAMAAGLVSVAYDAGGIAEAVEPDVTGLLVPPADTAALISTVSRVLADDALRDRAREEGPGIVRARFDQAQIAARIVALYEELAG